MYSVYKIKPFSSKSISPRLDSSSSNICKIFYNKKFPCKNVDVFKCEGSSCECDLCNCEWKKIIKPLAN